MSGHDTFADNLNRFVADKGVLQKIILPLNIIAAEILLTACKLPKKFWRKKTRKPTKIS